MTVDVVQAGRFLSRKLEVKLPGVIKKKYPPLWGAMGMHIPTTGDLPLGSKKLVIETIEEVGEAAIYDGLANDIPLADVTAGEETYKASVIISGFKAGVLELDYARRLGVDIGDERMMAMSRAINEKIHKIALRGTTKHGMTGFFNNPNVNRVDITTNFYDPATTADNLIDFVNSLTNSIRKYTKMVEAADMILCSVDFANRLNKRVPDSGVAVIDNILNRRGQTLKDIVPVNELDASVLEEFGVHPAGTNKERIIVYPMSSEILERKFSPMDTLPPQLHIMDYLTIGYCGTSEVIWRYPDAALYVDIPKAA